MKNIIINLIVFFSVLQLFSQKVCVTEENTHIDVNTLDVNKCVIEKGISSNEDKKDVIVSNVRYFKKRVYFNKVNHLSSHLKANTVLKIKLDNKLDTRLLLALKEHSVAKKVSFDLVEEIPLFATCVNDSVNKTECFNYEMQKHITKHFVYPKKALQEGIEGDIDVSFVIDVNGDVKDVNVKGIDVNEVLKKEARRIVLLLPKFISGKQNGVKTNVQYSFPMSFILE